jgi:two-component system phosphate regulon sensor histidine kinase PhoR
MVLWRRFEALAIASTCGQAASTDLLPPPAELRLEVTHQEALGSAFEAAFEAVPNGVVLLDAEQRIVWLNANACVHLALEPQGDIGQSLTNLVRDPALVAALNTPQSAEDFRIGSHRADQVLLVQVRSYAPERRMVLTHDVTESDRMEAMRRDFVSHVSHEIRTPLTVLAGFVETMQTLALQEREQNRVLDLMRQQTSRMEGLVSDLLLLATLEGSPKPPIAQWVHLTPLLQSAVADGHHLSGGKHELVCSEVPVEDLEVAVEEREMSSALGNLVSNAVRYTPEAGRIDLQAQWRSDGYLEIRVVDNGIGIERHHLPRITQRFYRVDKSRSRATGGTGLGLAIVKHAITRHGGELLVDSTPGQGSCFTLTLPPARVRVALPKDNETSDLTPSSPS